MLPNRIKIALSAIVCAALLCVSLCSCAENPFAESGSGEKAPLPQTTGNFSVYDAVSGSFYLDVTTSFDGETVTDITKKLLSENDIIFVTKNTGFGLYLARIGEKGEFDDGASSGWCFYVRKAGEESYTRSPTGGSNVIPAEGDAVLWVYKKNSFE